MLLGRVRRKERRDDGAALISVVALMLITAVVGVVITAAVINANGFSTSTRADTQARAAADSGVDVALARIVAGNYVCTAPATSGGPVYTATVKYANAAGTQLTCTGSTAAGVPASAVITSIGQSVNRATNGGSGNTHTVIAALAITPAATPQVLDKAVFSEAGFTITNDTSILESATGAKDAALYSNGSMVCNTQIEVEGELRSQGSIALNNNCEADGDVWTGGDATFSSSPILHGNLYVAGTGAVTLGTAHIDGSLISNGSVTLSDTPGSSTCAGTSASARVCGSVVSINGAITASNGAAIGGSAYAKNAISLNTYNGALGIGADALSVSGSFVNSSGSQGGRVSGSARVAGTIGGLASMIGNKPGSCQGTATTDFAKCTGTLVIPAPNPAAVLPPTLGYPAVSPAVAVVNEPPREEMPRINSAAADLANWTSAGWTITTFSATVGGKTSCVQAQEFVATARTGKQLVIVRNCADPVRWDNATISLGGDLAMMSTTGFESSNILTIKSSTSTARSLMFIVPADSPGITWTAVTGTSPTQYTPSCSPNRGISSNNTSVTNVSWFLYTPCATALSNQVSFKGQVYSGSMTYPNNSTIRMAQFSVPGLVDSSSGSGTGTATITSRKDVNGS